MTASHDGLTGATLVYFSQLGVAGLLHSNHHGLERTLCHSTRSFRNCRHGCCCSATTFSICRQDSLAQGAASNPQCKGKQVVRVIPVVVLPRAGRLCSLPGLPACSLAASVGIVNAYGGDSDIIDNFNTHVCNSSPSPLADG